MTLMLLGQYFLIMRSSMVDVLTEDFITVKRATGLPWDRVVQPHAVPNALLPLVTLSAIQFGAVAGGAITIETIFSWPGLGELSFNAINDKDFPVLQGTFLVFCVGVILANLLADCLYFFLDPRVQATMTATQRVRDLLFGTWRGRFGLGVLGLFVFVGDLRQPDRALRPERVEPRRARSRPARSHWLGHDRERLRRLLAAARRRARLDRRRLRRGGDLGGPRRARRPRSAATSAAGPTASSTRSRTGSWSSRRCR